MLFQTQKNLFQEAVTRISGALEKGSNPQDPSQYITIKVGNKSVSTIFSGQEIAARLVIDKDKLGGLLTIGEEGIYVIQGHILNQILLRTAVNNNITVDFEKAKNAESDRPTNGNIKITMPSSTGNEAEEWLIPTMDTNSMDIPTNPSIENKGTERLTVKASDLVKHIRQVGMAVGSDGGDATYRNVMFRTGDKVYEMVGTNMNQLALARNLFIKSSGNFIMTIPHSQVLRISGMLNQELDVEIIYNTGNPGTAVFRQDIVYGDNVIGAVEYRVTCSNEPFAKFDKLINALSFRNTCKMKTQQIRPICSKLDIIQPPRTEVILSAKKQTLSFSKKEGGKGATKGQSVPLTDIQGDDFEFVISSAHLSLAVSNAESDEIEWKFSGKTSLSCMVLSENLTTYFSPFDDENA